MEKEAKVYLFGAIALIFFLFMNSIVFAAILDDWSYSNTITITENSGSDLTDYQVLIELGGSSFDFSKAQSDGADIRFTNSEDTLLSYWIETWDSTAEKAKVWVKVPNIPADSAATIMIYYGNENAANASNGDMMFDYFDDFESYTPGIFPSAGGWAITYSGAGVEYQKVVDTFSVSGINSFQALGQDGWSAFVRKPFILLEDLIGYEVMVMPTGPDCGVTFFDKDAPNWGKYFADIFFNSDMTIRAQEGDAVRVITLQPYEYNKWYKIKVVLNKNTGLYNVWIDGALKAEDIAVNNCDEIKSFDVYSGFAGNKCYFDNVIIRSYASAEPTVTIEDLSFKWTKYPENPVLDLGAPGEWDDGHVEYPMVIKTDSFYEMWYTGGHVGPYSGNNKIGYAHSTDGIHWTKHSENPVLSTGSNWDSYYVYSPTVIKEESTYKMWYVGYAGGTIAAVGHATSSNGINWTKYADNPVLSRGASGEWDARYVNNPTVIKDGAIYKMWYAGNAGSGESIGYATSTDGIQWTKYAGNPVLEHVNRPKVFKDGSVYRMYYRGDFEIHGKYRACSATSIDGINWVKSNDNPILELGADGTWDDYGTDHPIVIKDETTYKMWYAGYDGDSHGRIGYATNEVSSIPSSCEGDFDDDSDIDGSDLAVFSANFGRTDCNNDCLGDFDRDGDVDGSDLAVFAADFGRTDCP